MRSNFDTHVGECALSRRAARCGSGLLPPAIRGERMLVADAARSDWASSDCYVGRFGIHGRPNR